MNDPDDVQRRTLETLERIEKRLGVFNISWSVFVGVVVWPLLIGALALILLLVGGILRIPNFLQ